MNQSGDAPLSDDDCRDLSNLVKQYMSADGIIEPEKAPPDMRVSAGHHRRPTHSLPFQIVEIIHYIAILEYDTANTSQDLLARLQDIQKQARNTQQQGVTVTPEAG